MRSAYNKFELALPPDIVLALACHHSVSGCKPRTTLNPCETMHPIGHVFSVVQWFEQSAFLVAKNNYFLVLHMITGCFATRPFHIMLAYS